MNHTVLQAQVTRVSSLNMFFPFWTVYLYGLDLLRQRGIFYYATRGYDSLEGQAEVYAIGRTKPNLQDYLLKPPFGSTVSDAPPSLSTHNYGIAVDSAFDRLPRVKKLQPSWQRQSYLALGACMEGLGLCWGGRFSHPCDGVHVQWPGYVSGRQIRALRTICNANNLLAVWDYLDIERRSPEWKARHPKLAATLASLKI